MKNKELDDLIKHYEGKLAEKQEEIDDLYRYLQELNPKISGMKEYSRTLSYREELTGLSYYKKALHNLNSCKNQLSYLIGSTDEDVQDLIVGDSLYITNRLEIKLSSFFYDEEPKYTLCIPINLENLFPFFRNEDEKMVKPEINVKFRLPVSLVQEWLADIDKQIEKCKVKIFDLSYQ